MAYENIFLSKVVTMQNLIKIRLEIFYFISRENKFYFKAEIHFWIRSNSNAGMFWETCRNM